jgi:hypothetical protein
MAGFYGPAGGGAAVCQAGYYCPVHAEFGEACPPHTVSEAGAHDVLACQVYLTCLEEARRLLGRFEASGNFAPWQMSQPRTAASVLRAP